MENDRYLILRGNSMEGKKTALVDKEMLRMCVLEGGDVSLVFDNGFVLPMHYESKDKAKEVYERAIKAIIPSWGGEYVEGAQGGGHE